MKEELLLKCFIETMRLKLAPGENLATFLMQVLSLGKEAIYRRLRGEVPFTFEEVALIAQDLHLSLDELIGRGETAFIPFYFARSSLIDEEPLAGERGVPDHTRWLDEAKRSCDPGSEAGVALNLLPVVLMMNYPSLLKFRVFKWFYQRNGGNEIKPYREVVVPRKLLWYGADSYLTLAKISNIFVILDKMVITHAMNDIRSFAMIGLLSREEVEEIKRDLLALLDGLERMAATGQNKMGNKLDLFLSDISFESTYVYTTSRAGTSCGIGIFSMNSIYSLNNNMFHAVKKWVDSLKQYSLLITLSGEVQRRHFFKKQREMIASL
ncbi:MAG: hypothetical protein LBP56_09725 [Odoribacteraceae bacterium]|jgi:hypothetical protein|nr:hypothetical protein [Odoribacteraceae bacterium]